MMQMHIAYLLGIQLKLIGLGGCVRATKEAVCDMLWVERKCEKLRSRWRSDEFIAFCFLGKEWAISSSNDPPASNFSLVNILHHTLLCLETVKVHGCPYPLRDHLLQL
jgi:hypothetical protein